MNYLNCKIEGCIRKHKAFSYCNLHYRRFKKHQDPLKVDIDHNLEKGQAGLNFLYYTYKRRANKKKVEFNLNKEFAKKLIVDVYKHQIKTSTE